MKKTNLLLQQCLTEAGVTRVKINNSQYKDTSGFLMSCNNIRAKIFIEDKDCKIITVPSYIVQITEFNNRQLSLEHLLPAIIAVAGSNNYYPQDINDIFKCRDFKTLNITLNRKGIKNNNINYIHNIILKEELIVSAAVMSIILNAIHIFIGDTVWGLIDKYSNKALNSIIQNTIQTFPGATKYLNGLSKYGPITVYIGSIYIASKMARKILERLSKGSASIDNLKEDFKKIVRVQSRTLNWLKGLQEPITEEEAIEYFRDPEKYFIINAVDTNFLHNMNNIGNSLYANESTKDIFYFDEKSQNLSITNRYHSKKHIKISKAEEIISNNSDRVINISIFALAPSGIVPRALNRVRELVSRRNQKTQDPSPRYTPEALPEQGAADRTSSASSVEDTMSALLPDDIL